MISDSIKAGERFGDFVLVKRIGSGGNGQVWRASGPNGDIALKLLTKIKPIAYARFKDEVMVMSTCGVVGVVPILASNLPSDINDSRPWYAMPLGIPLFEHLEETRLAEVVANVAQIAESLAALHSRGVSHRDIKEANLLFLDGRAHIGDFGLVDFPEKVDLTQPEEELGPRFTMAPEAWRLGNRAKPLPADVYSLAKTLWILVSRNRKGFDGQYSPMSSVAIAQFAKGEFITPIDQLLFDATAHNPKDRPTMQQFAARLNEWLRINETFLERCRLEWIDVQRKLFPVLAPCRATWTSLNDIVTVLNLIGERSNMNHLFFPSGGGLDLTGARLSTREVGCIELLTDGYVSILRPKSLQFESFGYDYEWDYFRLEASELEPSGVYPDLDRNDEELTEIGGEFYAPRHHWDSGYFEHKSLPEGSRSVSRYFRGSFVIFGKESIYNHTSGTYDARHDKVSADQFRSYIEGAAKHFAARRDKQVPSATD